MTHGTPVFVKVSGIVIQFNLSSFYDDSATDDEVCSASLAARGRMNQFSDLSHSS